MIHTATYTEKLHSYHSSHRAYHPHKAHTRSVVTSRPILDSALSDLCESLPDWEVIEKSFVSDGRDFNNIDNMTGALAEHVVREELKRHLLAYAACADCETYIHENPMPETAAHVGKYVFVRDAYSGNYVVYNPFTNQALTEYDDVIAVETIDKKGQSDVLIIVVESKLSLPRLPQRKGPSHVKRYIEKKLKPLRVLFDTPHFAFVMTTCDAKGITGNQQRFMRAMKKVGGKVASLGVYRDDLHAMALSYL